MVSSREKLNIFVIAAHPDDDILGCGGLISKLTSSGESVRVIFIAEGTTCRYNNITEKVKKEIASKDTKGNPKTYKMDINLKIYAKDEKNNLKEKSFSKSINYNNSNNKSKLKKYENETAENLTEKIAEEIIIYLQSI